MHPNETAINDYVDEALDARDRTDVGAHLEQCAACRELVDDLREIRRATADLELREPPVRAWRRIERAIKLDGEARSTEGPQRGLALRSQRALRSTWAVWLAAAAALMLATAVGLRFSPIGRQATDQPTTTTSTAAGATIAAGEAAQSVETELRQAEDHYEKAIKGLEQIANAEKSALDPGTAATLQKNLAVIDQAINESRAAVRTQPNSEPAQQSLLDSFTAKIALLQDTVALINEMRKGNEAGAARIVSGIKPKGN